MSASCLCRLCREPSAPSSREVSALEKGARLFRAWKWTQRSGEWTRTCTCRTTCCLELYEVEAQARAGRFADERARARVPSLVSQRTSGDEGVTDGEKTFMYFMAFTCVALAERAAQSTERARCVRNVTGQLASALSCSRATHAAAFFASCG